MLSGRWLAGAGLGLLAGCALQLQEAALHPGAVYAAAALLGALALFTLGVVRLAPAGVLWGALVAAAALGWGSTGWRAGERLAEALAMPLEGVDIELTGVVASLPVLRSDGVRFRFEVESAGREGRTVAVPRLLALGWYRGRDEGSGAAASPDALRAGQRWRFTVRLRQPHGLANPHGFDYELWLFEQGVRATGSVRSNLPPQLLDPAAGQPVERARQAVRDALLARLGDTPAAGVLAALAVGDQASIARDDWAVFRATGVAHLVSISGLHVTMFVWLAGAAIGALWRRSEWLLLRWPVVQAGRWGGLAAGVAYTALAGWGVPAQRTLFMVAAATLLRAVGTRWPWPLVWGGAAMAVVLVDPWALLQPGFWLSFVAVGLLLASGTQDEAVPEALPGGRARWSLARAHLLTGLRTQGIATLGLAPLSLLFFHQLSLVGFLANLVAIPLITLAITPLALLGIVWSPLWSLAAGLMDALMAGLTWLASWPWASWSAAEAPPWAQAAGLLGAAVLVLPLPGRVRALGLPMLLPLLFPPAAALPPGQFEVLGADVGQGTAVLVRTAGHALLYDAGPQYSRDSDAGERVLVPLLRAEGVARLDVLMLSHRDTDHVGGAAAVAQGVALGQVMSSLEDGHALRGLPAVLPHQRCIAGQDWDWDGVRFEVLHPRAQDYPASGGETVKPNALSCVLRVSGGGRSVLLTGDIERPQELRLAQQAGALLRADVLWMPHHGSRTSSSADFLAAVQPRLALAQAGYRNRFGHPAPQVLARYQQLGIPVLRSDRCGAWRWRSDAAPEAGRCERSQALRYWHTRSPRDPGPLPASPADGPELANVPAPPSASLPSEGAEETAADPPDDPPDDLSNNRDVITKPP
ncbi:MAG TPA: DNA internalization-related competence protein ComEC/Rec2 [Burkholderiaceae bacterium]|nr:DNA internalization-related competence protein ComEC/Rec2 [Burkholderiaceae bacterium]